MFIFPSPLPELSCCDYCNRRLYLKMPCRINGQAGLQIENAVKKTPASFGFAAVTLYNPVPGTEVPGCLFFARSSAAAGIERMAEDLRSERKGPVDFSRLSDIVFHGVYWLLAIHIVLLVGLFVVCLWNSWLSVAVYYLSGIWPSSAFITFSSEIPGAVLELGNAAGNVLQIALAVWLWSCLSAWACALMNIVTVIFDHFRNWLQAIGNIVVMAFASCFYIAMMASVSKAFS